MACKDLTKGASTISPIALWQGICLVSASLLHIGDILSYLQEKSMILFQKRGISLAKM
jgi:hypothetical protein